LGRRRGNFRGGLGRRLPHHARRAAPATICSGREFAGHLGVDPATAAAALTDQRLADLVEKDYQHDIARGVSRTPTVLVNGRPFIESFTVEKISKAIESELAGGGAGAP